MSEKELYVALATKDAVFWGRSGYTNEQFNQLFKRIEALENQNREFKWRINELEKPKRQQKILELLREPHTQEFLRNRVLGYDFRDLHELVLDDRVGKVLRGNLTVYQWKEEAQK